MAKDAPYFSHDANADNDPKMMAMMEKYKGTGYGWLFIIYSVMRESENYKITKDKFTYFSLAKRCYSTKKEIEEFVNDCLSEYELLKQDNLFIWSESFLRRMDIKDGKKTNFSELGKKGADKRWGKDSGNIAPISPLIAPISEDSLNKNKQTKENKIKETKTKQGFVEFVSSCFSLESVEVEKFFEKSLKTYSEELIFEAANKINTEKEVSNPFGYITGIIKNIKAKEVDDDYYSPV